MLANRLHFDWWKEKRDECVEERSAAVGGCGVVAGTTLCRRTGFNITTCYPTKHSPTASCFISYAHHIEPLAVLAFLKLNLATLDSDTHRHRASTEHHAFRNSDQVQDTLAVDHVDTAQQFLSWYVFRQQKLNRPLPVP
jgi:hypothetical protein